MCYVIVCVRMSVRMLKNLAIVVLTRCEALSISESFSSLSIVGGTSVYLISILTESDFGAVTGTPTIFSQPRHILVLWPIHKTMAELKKLISTRRGFRAHLTKMLQTLAELLDSEHPPNEDNLPALKDLHKQLQRKEELISGLDAKILEGITSDDDIEAKILQTEEINSSISTAKAKISRCLSSTTPTEVTPRRPGIHSSPPDHVTRLSKLDLPQFTGNPLHWQSFWDCFEATVHSNTSLTGVQKLSYLRAQLCGDAARVIAGFELTNSSYDHSIALLKERFE